MKKVSTDLCGVTFSGVENCHSTVHVKQVEKESGVQMRDHLGTILSHKQAILVSQTRRSFIVVAGSCHETSTNRQYASSRLRCARGLGILLWGCCKTTNSTPRDHHGSTWHTPWVYVPKAMQDLREACVNCLWQAGQYGRASRENDLNEDEEDDFDESSDEEVVEDLREDTTLLQGEIESSATFLREQELASGLVIRFKNCLLWPIHGTV